MSNANKLFRLVVTEVGDEVVYDTSDILTLLESAENWKVRGFKVKLYEMKWKELDLEITNA